MWGCVSGILSKPTDASNEKYAAMLEIWDVNNSKIITYINNSVEHKISTQLAKHEAAKEV